MKKTIYLFTLLLAFISCNSGSKKTEQSNESIDTVAEKTVEQESALIAYSDCSLAYLKDGKLYFYNVEQDKKVVFTEEPDTIRNFVFDEAGATLYYGVEKDNMLWLKSVNINQEELNPEWLISWNLKREDYYAQTSGESSPLYLYKGNNIVIRHNFSWHTYDFKLMSFYSITNKKITQKKLDYAIIQELSNAKSENKVKQNFKTINKQLYYTKGGKKVCLTDQLQLEKLRNEETKDYWVETEYHFFIQSEDETKVAFGCILEFGDLPHGVFCIANTDGSNQMLLESTDVAYNNTKTWIGNQFVFIDAERNLLIADNDKGSIVKIEENVSDFKVK